MRVITKQELTTVVAELVKEKGTTHRDFTHSLFNMDGTGACFVGALMVKMGISIDTICEGKIEVRIRRQPTYGRLAPSFEIVDAYDFRDTETGEEFCFESGTGVLLCKSMSDNDAGIQWGQIALDVWGVDEAMLAPDCPCPLCDVEARATVYHPYWNPAPAAKLDPIYKLTSPIVDYQKQLTASVV